MEDYQVVALMAHRAMMQQLDAELQKPDLLGKRWSIEDAVDDATNILDEAKRQLPPIQLPTS